MECAVKCAVDSRARGDRACEAVLAGHAEHVPARALGRVERCRETMRDRRTIEDRHSDDGQSDE